MFQCIPSGFLAPFLEGSISACSHAIVTREAHHALHVRLQITQHNVDTIIALSCRFEAI